MLTPLLRLTQTVGLIALVHCESHGCGLGRRPQRLFEDLAQRDLKPWQQRGLENVARGKRQRGAECERAALCSGTVDFERLRIRFDDPVLWYTLALTQSHPSSPRHPT